MVRGAAGNGGGDPALAMDTREGARGNGNSEGGPTLATHMRHADNGNGNVRGPPALGEVTSYGTDTVTRAAADNAERCHEQGINKRRRTRHQVELQQDGG